jgi:4-hydroxy-tetrahydrodipicolinate synthase
MNQTIKGVVPIVLTPLLKNGNIDFESCSSLVNYLITSGVAGLFILGSASENFLLDTGQRVDTVKAMSDANNGRVPLIAGCSNLSPRNVYRFFKLVKNFKLSGLHYIPYDLKIGDQRLIYQVSKYADESPFPIYLYHNIKRGRPITINVAKELKKHKNIKGMKVGGYNLGEFKQFLKLEDNNFQIFGSGGGQFLTWLSFGAKAVTASSACCFPREFKKLYDYYISGNFEKAEKIQNWWKKFHSRIPNTAPENGEYAAEEKYILKKIGIIKYDYCHFPYRELINAEKEIINKNLKKYYDEKLY